MNKFHFFMAAALVLCVFSTRAAEFPISAAYNTVSTNLLTTVATNSVSSALPVDQNLYHTFIVINLTTNANTVALERSLGGTYWVVFASTNLAGISTNEFTSTGKWTHVRARETLTAGTNCNVTVTYLGGR